jgi:hypothetical protein
MGILDSKTRIMDVLVTSQGRRQIAMEGLQIKYASFTDLHTFYQGDTVSGSTDSTNRVYFEAFSRPQDFITFETDDSGQLFPFAYNDTILNGSSISKISTSDSTFGESTFANTGEIFASSADTLIETILESFNDQRTIATRDPFLEDFQFSLSTGSALFRFDNDTFENGTKPVVSINSVESVIFDKRLSHIPNFKFLPPVAIDDGGTTKFEIGKYSNLNQVEELSYEDLEKSLKGKQSVNVDFVKTSVDNNLLMQMFETAAGQFTKLDAIDFGAFVTEDPARPGKHVFFLGKVFIDEQGMPTFVNMFTIILD